MSSIAPAAALEKLACPQCGAAVTPSWTGRLRCGGCGASYRRDGGVLDLLVDRQLATSLEAIDYDGTGNINDRAIEAIGRSWLSVLAAAGVGLQGRSVLEVGAGTGALTIGLLRQSGAAHVFATDISRVFLGKTLSRAGDDQRLTAVRCDCNHLPVRNGAFDVIVGRSILHHLLDYENVLAQCARILGDGGKAVFYEPILDGKMVSALFAELVLGLVARDGDDQLTPEDIKRLKAFVRHITKAAWCPQDRDSLAKIEDKYIFSLAGMRSAGERAGFRIVELIDAPDEPLRSSWEYFVRTVQLVGVPANKMAKYRFVADAFEQTYGLFPELRSKPMGYFCFSK